MLQRHFNLKSMKFLSAPKTLKIQKIMRNAPGRNFVLYVHLNFVLQDAHGYAFICGKGESRRKLPEFGLGADLVGRPQLHTVDLRVLICLRRQSSSDHLVLVELQIAPYPQTDQSSASITSFINRISRVMIQY